MIFWMQAVHYDTLEPWALEWKKRIGRLYQLNKLRLAQWDPDVALSEQPADFNQCQQALRENLQGMHDEAHRAVSRI